MNANDSMRPWNPPDPSAECRAGAVSALVAIGLHPVRARRLVKDTALVAAAEGGLDAIGIALDLLVERHRQS